jgi:SAM-dependent methyltransferase
MSGGYVHGHDRREHQRLRDQAGALVDLLHAGTAYPAGSTVLEAGCGVGAQTITLARRSPEARFVSVDVSADSIAEARRRAGRAGLTNVEFRRADIFALPFDAASFDHVFVCFVLEHLRRPWEALAILHRLLRPGGTITAIEGDHGSAYFHPDSPAARAAIRCQVELQRAAGGDALIGRQLYPLLVGAGFGAVRVSPRMVYADASRPDLVDGFTRRTFTAMVEGVREPAIAAGRGRSTERVLARRGAMPAAAEGAESAVVVGVGVPRRDAPRRVWQAIERARGAHLIHSCIQHADCRLWRLAHRSEDGARARSWRSRCMALVRTPTPRWARPGWDAGARCPPRAAALRPASCSDAPEQGVADTGGVVARFLDAQRVIEGRL